MTKTTGNFNYLCCAASHHLVFKSNFQPVLEGKKRTFTPQGKVLFNWLTRMTYSCNLIRVQLWCPVYGTLFFHLSLDSFVPSVFAVVNFSGLRMLILSHSMLWIFIYLYPSGGVEFRQGSDRKSCGDFSFLLIFRSQLTYPGNDEYADVLLFYSISAKYGSNVCFSGRQLVLLVFMVQVLRDLRRRTLHEDANLQQPSSSVWRRHLLGPSHWRGSM